MGQPQGGESVMGSYRYTPRTLVRECIMVLIGLVWMIPFFLLINVSIKPPTGYELYGSPFAVSSHPTLAAYPTAWRGSAFGSLSSGFLSSAIITSASVFFLIVIGSLTAYTLSRRGGRASYVLTALFTFALVLPVQLGTIPLFAEMRKLGLVGNYFGIIIVYIGLLMPLCIFLYMGFLRSLPLDYEQAARVDGASPVRIFFRVVFPLLRPATGTVAILCGLIIWNDFFTPLIFLNGSSHATLPVVIYGLVDGLGTEWNVIFAAVAISIAPLIVFFIFAQRQLIRGYTGGVKA